MRALWNRLSLRSRLFASFSTLLAVILAFSLILQSSFYTSSRVELLLEEELPSQLEKLGDQVALRLAPSIQLSRSLASNTFIVDWIERGMPEDEYPAVKREMARVDQQLGANTVFVVGNTGDEIRYMHYADGVLQSRLIREEVASDSWYFNYIRSGAPYELNLDVNDLSGENFLMFFNYSSSQEAERGWPRNVAGAALDMQQMGQMISDYRLGVEGRASLVTADGVLEVGSEDSLVHILAGDGDLGPLLNQDGVNVQQLQDRQGQRFFVGSIWVDDLQRFLIMEVPRDEFMAGINQQLLISLLIGALLILLSVLLLYPLSGTLIRPIRQFQDELEEITNSLDLRKRIHVPEDAELGKLAKQTNGLLQRLDEIIGAVAGNSDKLSDSAKRLAYTAGLVSRNSSLQDEVSQSMAAAVEEMSSSVAEITSTMEELSASSTQIADHSQSVVDVANLTLENSRKGVDAMQQLQGRMHDIHQDNQQNLTEIMELGAKSKQISRVMDLINDLADQTKLIAFNAALEASSAGESGKRFSVVAAEIRRLADSVTDSTREIEERIQEIQDSISRLVINSEKGVTSIQSGLEVSATTAEDLNALLQAASQTSSAAEQISLSTRQQKTASSQVVVALRDIASASSHNAHSVRQITEISEEMIAMSDHLHELVKAFK
ncbi:methyl-accepting chemotaxis protein [Marinospirillum celere]|uniref:Methyl-accepting chemotaxis protein n=1 Tax=Marinospirillum celere TaxID=1122252 RepID=A0A1I1EKY9_9GAMM|nr:HAMP domain-containing methyl-accepting chemotaxis protein [Marinospirillum celere]SFB87737.1 methyl-accepting chemotaxis protein [Marinospirillum celere]